MSRDYLFSTYDSHNVKKATSEKMLSEIAAYNGDQLLNTNTDDLVNYFAAKFAIDIPSLLEDQMQLDHHETTREMNRGRSFDYLVATLREKTMKTKLAIVLLSLSACTYPNNYSQQPMNELDRNGDYSVVDNPKGFTITVQHSRYQFIPETDALLQSCKSALFSSAYDYADGKGREIKPINEQRLKISTGRNGLSGITSCSASVQAEFK